MIISDANVRKAGVLSPPKTFFCEPKDPNVSDFTVYLVILKRRLDLSEHGLKDQRRYEIII